MLYITLVFHFYLSFVYRQTDRHRYSSTGPLIACPDRSSVPPISEKIIRVLIILWQHRGSRLLAHYRTEIAFLLSRSRFKKLLSGASLTTCSAPGEAHFGYFLTCRKWVNSAGTLLHHPLLPNLIKLRAFFLLFVIVVLITVAIVRSLPRSAENISIWGGYLLHFPFRRIDFCGGECRCRGTA